MGDAVADALDELRAWLQTQIPCSVVTVSLTDASVTVDFGDLADNCTYNGHTYAGVVMVSIEKNDVGDVQVSHVWTGFTNGDLTLNGAATVTWVDETGAREVTHDVLWTDTDGREIHATGQRTVTLLDSGQGVEGGIEINGWRHWDSQAGNWELEISGVEARPQDPVPQAGSYSLTTPQSNLVVMSFERQDADTIRVSILANLRSWIFDVTSDGSIESVDEENS